MYQVLPKLRSIYPKLNVGLSQFRCHFNTLVNSDLTKKIVTPEFLSTQSRKGDTVVYIGHSNENINENQVKAKYCSKNTKLVVTNVKNVDQRVFVQYEINTLPAVFHLKNGNVTIDNKISEESNVLQKNNKLVHQVESLKLLVQNVNTDLNLILSELMGLIRDYSVLFSTRGELVQLASAAAVTFSDIPSYTLDQLFDISNNPESVSFNTELGVLVDSIFYGDNYVQVLDKILKPDNSNYSESQYKARVYRAISSRYFREGNNKMALDYAYKSLQLDVEYQNSMIDDVMKLDPYKIDIYSESVATVFMKHLIMAIGNTDEVLDVRSKIEFMFRDSKYVPVKLNPKSHPPGGPPMKGRGYRAKWIWHGLDYRPRKYKPRNIYKYHDEWRTVHDGPVINY